MSSTEARRLRKNAGMARLRKRIRNFLDLLKRRPCLDCGGEFPPFVMQFDHVRGQKKFNLAHAVNHVYTIDGVKQEAIKCDVVCANCHAIRTHG